MDYKPADLFIGVIDLFAIILPGAVVSFVYSDAARTYVFGPITPPLPGGRWNATVFAFASYLLGHFMFAVGSKLDDWVGDRLRAWRFADKERPLLRAVKQLKWKALPPRFDAKRAGPLALSADVTMELDPATFDTLEKSEVVTVNAFQWAKMLVDLHAPSTATEVDRLEADSKFFRTLIVAAVLVAPYLMVRAYGIGIGPLLLTVLALAVVIAGSLWRYVEQRQKSIRVAYTYVLASDAAARGPAARSQPTRT